VARAYRPVSVSARFDRMAWAGHSAFAADLWAVSSLPRPLEAATVVWRLVGADGSVYGEGRWSGTIPSRQPLPLLRTEVPLDGLVGDLFYLALELADAAGTVLTERRYPFSRTGTMEPMLSVPRTSVQAEKREAGADRWLVTLANAGGHAALQLHLEDARPLSAAGYAYFSDNDWTLFPGEKKTFSVDWSGVPEEQRVLEIAGWNTDTIAIGQGVPE